MLNLIKFALAEFFAPESIIAKRGRLQRFFDSLGIVSAYRDSDTDLCYCIYNNQIFMFDPFNCTLLSVADKCPERIRLELVLQLP